MTTTTVVSEKEELEDIDEVVNHVLSNALRRVDEQKDRDPEEVVAAFNNFA